ncbi:hypothetical protein MKW92_041161, partial [Papaver armeniacum]
MKVEENKEYVSEFISFITSKLIQFSMFFQKRKPLKMEGDTKDSTKGGDGSAKKDGAGVQHKHNFH